MSECILVDSYFILPSERLIGPKGMKRNDASNRLKALYDRLSEVLDVDDSRFVTGRAENCIGDGPRVHLVLTACHLRDWESVERGLQVEKESRLGQSPALHGLQAPAPE